jgi:ribosomal protein S18 acetylase RimI-like enzyme
MFNNKLNTQFNTNPSIELLESFFNNNPKNQNAFRYFKNRNFDSIKNHTLTLLMYQNNNIVGYGHLDRENDITWLGVMLGDKHTGKGLGGIIIDRLTQNRTNDIHLSVDKENLIAKNLYTKKGFYTVEEKEKYIIMKLNK